MHNRVGRLITIRAEPPSSPETPMANRTRGWMRVDSDKIKAYPGDSSSLWVVPDILVLLWKSLTDESLSDAR